MFEPRFSPDGKHFGYVVAENKTVDYSVVLNGAPGPRYDQIVHYSFRLENTAASYVARRGNRIYAVTHRIRA
jgi:hypothetical protein